LTEVGQSGVLLRVQELKREGEQGERGSFPSCPAAVSAGFSVAKDSGKRDLDENVVALCAHTKAELTSLGRIINEALVLSRHPTDQPLSVPNL
jgi:hypothetical protein